MNEVHNDAPDDIHNAVGSYLVDALEGQELSEFEAHLEGCDRCTHEVRDFGETLAELSAQWEIAPPPTLRASVLSAIAETSQLTAEDESEESAAPAEAAATTPNGTDELARARHAATERADSTAQNLSVDQPTPVVQLDQVRERRRASRAWIAVAAAAAVIAVGVGGWGISLNHQLRSQQAGQSVVQQQAQRETALLHAPDAKIYSAKLNDGTPVSYVVSKRQNAAMLVGGDLPNPGSGKTYQLWTVRGTSDFVRDKAFVGGVQQRVFLTSDIDKADALGISIETAGSQPVKPSGTPFAVASI